MSVQPGASLWTMLSEQVIREKVGYRLGLTFGPPTFVGLGGRSDGTAAMGPGRWIFLEIERSQTHPEGNVVKYWPWLEDTSESAVLIHVIAPDARKRAGRASSSPDGSGVEWNKAHPSASGTCT